MFRAFDLLSLCDLSLSLFDWLRLQCWQMTTALLHMQPQFCHNQLALTSPGRAVMEWIVSQAGGPAGLVASSGERCRRTITNKVWFPDNWQDLDVPSNKLNLHCSSFVKRAERWCAGRALVEPPRDETFQFLSLSLRLSLISLFSWIWVLCWHWVLIWVPVISCIWGLVWLQFESEFCVEFVLSVRLSSVLSWRFVVSQVRIEFEFFCFESEFYVEFCFDCEFGVWAWVWVLYFVWFKFPLGSFEKCKLFDRKTDSKNLT